MGQDPSLTRRRTTTAAVAMVLLLGSLGSLGFLGLVGPVGLRSQPVGAQSDPEDAAAGNPGTEGGGAGNLDPLVVERYRVPMSDGVELLVQAGGRAPAGTSLPARPIVVEFTPYGQACCPRPAGEGFNHLQVHLRGTGDSNGAFDALGPRSQRDVVEVMEWACDQDFSDGRAGIWGFSASAIMFYNSLHEVIPCLEAAVMGSGTNELYRDLLYPGGIPNIVPGIGVLALIGAPTLALGPDRLGRDPVSAVDALLGMLDTGLDYLAHPTLDEWWTQRGSRGDVNRVPVLMIDGFFDVESRGAFEAFREIGGESHLYVVGAHDGVPRGSGGADEVTRRWFRRFLLGEDNGVDREPTVQLWLANGDRVRMLDGDFVTRQANSWPVEGTRWVSLHLDPTRSGSSTAANDGTLSLTAPSEASTDVSVPLPSLATATDPATTSLLGVFNGATSLTDMTIPEPLGLAYTTAPLAEDVTVVGPMSLEAVLTSSMAQTDIYAVLSDVWPDGTAHPVAHGRLRTAYPHLVDDRTRRADGVVVQPYTDFSRVDPPPPGQEHRFHVEFFPVGNRFQAGHRLRLHLVGASAFSLPSVPGLNTIRLGGPDGGSVLRVPVLPESDLPRALGTIAPASPDPAPLPAPVATAPSGRPGVVGPDQDPSTEYGNAATPSRLPSTGGAALPGAALAALALGVAFRLRRRGDGQPLIESTTARQRSGSEA